MAPAREAGGGASGGRAHGRRARAREAAEGAAAQEHPPVPRLGALRARGAVVPSALGALVPREGAAPIAPVREGRARRGRARAPKARSSTVGSDTSAGARARPAEGGVPAVQAPPQEAVGPVVPVHLTLGRARVASVAAPEEPATAVATPAKGAGRGRRSATAVPAAPALAPASRRTAAAAAAGEGVA